MIKLFCGERGSGKTQRMVADANAFAEVAKGNVVYLDRDFNRIHDVTRNIRLVNVKDYGISDDVQLISFIKGLIAGNADIQRIYIDSIAKLTGKSIFDLKDMFKEMAELSGRFDTEFVLTAEGRKEDLPLPLQEYANEQ